MYEGMGGLGGAGIDFLLFFCCCHNFSAATIFLLPLESAVEGCQRLHLIQNKAVKQNMRSVGTQTPCAMLSKSFVGRIAKNSGQQTQ